MQTRLIFVGFCSMLCGISVEELLVEKYLSLTDENQLCQSTADEQTTVESIQQCISRCLEMGDTCMKLTVIKGSGHCLISSNATTQPCTASDSHTFIVRPELIPQMPTRRTVTTPALIGAAGVNIAAGKTIAENSQHYTLNYAHNAVDGLTDSGGRYCGLYSEQAYLTIDLEAVFMVQFVKIWNSPSQTYQIRDTEVTVATTLEGLNMDAALCGIRVGEPASIPDIITCSSVMSGRYVKVFRSSTHHHFCVYEIEVFSA